MEQRRRNRATQRSVWLSPYLLAVALTPAFLQSPYNCNPGETRLSLLEVEVSGVDQIVGFDPSVHYYSMTTSGETLLVRAVTLDPAATATYQLRDDTTVLEVGALGTGGGEASIGVPAGESILAVQVRSPEGGLASYNVNITRQSFPCAEQGILDAIAQGGGPHFFDCNGPTTVVTQAEIVIDNDVILDGEGNLTVDGNNDHRVLSVEPSATAELVGVTVTRGFLDSPGAQGAGVFNQGTLTITDSVIASNGAPTDLLANLLEGGGIYNAGTLTLDSTTVQGNDAYYGCGIHNVGTATLISSNVSQNGGDTQPSLVEQGSGIFNEGGILTLIDTTVSLNKDGEVGDAAAIDSYDATLLLINSVVSDNRSTQSAGIWALGTSTATLINSTVSGNQSSLIDQIEFSGQTTLTLISSTVVGGDAIGSYFGAAELVVANTIIAGDEPCYGVSQVTSVGGNIESGGNTCGLTDPTDLVNVTATELNLGPLADNGGTTMTRALLPGSVAIDHVPTAMCVDENGDQLTTDQRGVARPQGAVCDTGAFEYADCSGSDCDDGNDCTADYCDPPDYSWCVSDVLPDGTFCEVDGVCEAGTCRERSWGTPVLVSDPSLTAGVHPRVAADQNGTAVAVWNQNDGPQQTPWSNRFNSASGWGVAEPIHDDGNVTSVSFSEVAVDPSGNAIAVWTQSDAAGWRAYANHFTPTDGWVAAQSLGGPTGSFAGNARIAFDRQGNAIAVWDLRSAQPTDVYANRFTPSGGWGVAEVIDDSTVDDAAIPEIAFDSNGDAVAVWIQSGMTNSVWAGVFTRTGGWGVPERIDDDLGSVDSSPELALDPSGNAVAVWTQREGTRLDIWVNRFSALAGWGAPELIEQNNTGSARSPQVAVDPTGNAIVVWNQADASGWHNIWANQYAPATGWGIAGPIENGSTDNIFATDIAMDARGNAVVVWTAGGGARIEANRFTPATGWGTPQIISGFNVENPRVAMDTNGNAIAVWHRHFGSDTSIWSNRLE